MANGIKTFQIQINGLTESVKAVDALNESLKTLESRINALNSKTVSVGTKLSGGGSKSSSSSALSEEEKIQKQIEQLEEKRIAHSKQIYQNYLAAKDVLKEVENDQKQLAASERLQAKTYSNTMQGMKQELADIKSVMQTVDLGDTNQMKQMVDRANELNSKLKEIEQSYGQFGRNVGNYQSAFDGMEKFKVEVGGVTREFNTAREAAKTLSNELLNLPKGAEGADDLRAALQQVKSEIQDIGKSSSVMDNLLDTMESITAIASVGQGLRGLFGIDDSEIEKSIQKLVALQNILKGIEVINKQINTREGIGAWIAPFNSQIDKATAKLLAFNTAMLGTGKAAKVASTGVKLFSKALKGLTTLGVMVVIDLLIDGLGKLVDSFKKVDEVAEREKEVQKEVAEAYGNAQGKLLKYNTIVDNFNGSKKQEKKVVEEINKELGSTLGTYQSLAEWQDVLKKKGEAYIQTLVNQAKAQAALNEVTAAYANLEKVKQDVESGVYKSWLSTAAQEREKEAYALEKANERIEKAENKLKEVVTQNESFMKENGLGDYAPQIEKNGSKTTNALRQEIDTLNQLELRLMKDGLNKKLRQLDEEERQTINKLKENGRKSSSAIQQVQRSYAQLRQKEINEYLKNLEDSIKQSAKNIEGIQFELDIKNLENQINALKNTLEKDALDEPIINTILSKYEFKDILKDYDVKKEKLDFASTYKTLFDISEVTNQADEYYSFLLEYLLTKNSDIRKEIFNVYKTTNGTELEKLEAYYKAIENMFEKEYEKELLIIKSYNKETEETLKESIQKRLTAQEFYDDSYRQGFLKNIQEQGQLNKTLIEQQKEAALESERDRYSVQASGLTAQLQLVKDGMKAIEDVFKVKGLEGIETIKNTNKIEYEQYHDLFAKKVELEALVEDAERIHKDKLCQIVEDANNRIKQNEISTAKEVSTEQEKYFDNQISNLRDAQSKINEILSKQPKTNALGIVNIGATQKQYKELIDATKETVLQISIQKVKLEALWRRGLITPESKNAITQQLNDLEAEFKQLFQTVVNESNQTIPKFVQSCQVYLNQAMDSFQTIMNAVWDAQDAAFEKEQEKLDEENEMIQEALDKKVDMINEYKSSIDSIEDELANSRGDRRQHLIDQLNAEIEAERKAQKEKENLEKQEEANKRKQEKLEKERKKAQYKRDVLQAIVNGAMAVTFAAMNAWPIPAIPLMAMAASTTAAQLAIMQANKPYAKGGQLDGGTAVGPRHRDGGIKVLGGRAEIEGGEFITNRISTQMNTPLLEFINSKKKRIDVSDLIEFYSSGSIKKNLSTVRTKFEDGGYIPTLPNSLDIRDQLQNVIINQDNRPIYVSVVDINNKQEQVRQVQALAGLSY